MSGTYRATGVTLMAHKYRGTGRVLTFFTRERGKVEAVAQGVGKPGSSLAPAADLFALSELFFAEGRNLHRLTQARVIEGFEDLRKRPVALGYAGFWAELLAKATEPGEPMPETFDEFVEGLGLLAGGYDPLPVVATGAWRLLLRLGVGPDMDNCARCGRPAPAATVFVAAEGSVVCPDCFTDANGVSETSVPIRPPLRSLASTVCEMPLARINRVRAQPSLWEDLLRVARLQVRFHLGLDLKADEYLRQMRAG
ncbi:MAG: DNA repair protein RecO [Armatimonadetes bacterium]|nr:DNA repair protein RecO [Armatimonadota bacterium]